MSLFPPATRMTYRRFLLSPIAGLMGFFTFVYSQSHFACSVFPSRLSATLICWVRCNKTLVEVVRIFCAPLSRTDITESRRTANRRLLTLVENNAYASVTSHSSEYRPALTCERDSVIRFTFLRLLFNSPFLIESLLGDLILFRCSAMELLWFSPCQQSPLRSGQAAERPGA